MPVLSDLPPARRELYAAAGPVIRFRLLRDVLDRDESYIETAHHALDLRRLPEIERLVAAQEIDGSWGGRLCDPTVGTPLAVSAGSPSLPLSTETAFLRLCELGMESSEAIQTCVEKALLPTLFDDQLLWELEEDWRDERSRRAARRVVRDKALRLICRARFPELEGLKPMLETLLVEWEQSRHDGAGLPPTADSYAAVCWYPWSDDDVPRVREAVTQMSARAEETTLPRVPALMQAHVYRIRDKWEYLARPDWLLYELELAARVGVVHERAVTQWLLDELEAHQDADGWFRFEDSEPMKPWWYFPLEKTGEEGYPREWSFRAALIFALMEYDL